MIRRRFSSNFIGHMKERRQHGSDARVVHLLLEGFESCRIYENPWMLESQIFSKRDLLRRLGQNKSLRVVRPIGRPSSQVDGKTAEEQRCDQESFLWIHDWMLSAPLFDGSITGDFSHRVRSDKLRAATVPPY
jgi:hypothetical protein